LLQYEVGDLETYMNTENTPLNLYNYKE